MNNLQQLNKTLRASVDAGRRDITKMSALLKAEKERSEQLEEENAYLLLRLSKVDTLVENGPVIPDLSDPNRPTKLGEIYSEIYDNEWTDAFEALQAEGYDEEFAIETLHLTLCAQITNLRDFLTRSADGLRPQNVFDFCKQKSESMLHKTKDAVNFLFEEYKILQDTEEVPHHMTMPVKRVSSIKLPSIFQNDIQLQLRWKMKTGRKEKAIETLKVGKSDTVSNHVKLLQKEVAESMVPVVQKAYMKASWIDGEFVPALKPFIRKCIFLCWMMVVQSPQMSLHMVEADKEVVFDKNMYKEYTSSGQIIKFVVWPALLLYENGPMVGKGVAQGCK